MRNSCPKSSLSIYSHISIINLMFGPTTLLLFPIFRIQIICAISGQGCISSRLQIAGNRFAAFFPHPARLRTQITPKASSKVPGLGQVGCCKHRNETDTDFLGSPGFGEKEPRYSLGWDKVFTNRWMYRTELRK